MFFLQLRFLLPEGSFLVWVILVDSDRCMWSSKGIPKPSDFFLQNYKKICRFSLQAYGWAVSGLKKKKSSQGLSDRDNPRFTTKSGQGKSHGNVERNIPKETISDRLWRVYYFFFFQGNRIFPLDQINPTEQIKFRLKPWGNGLLWAQRSQAIKQHIDSKEVRCSKIHPTKSIKHIDHWNIFPSVLRILLDKITNFPTRNGPSCPGTQRHQCHGMMKASLCQLSLHHKEDYNPSMNSPAEN